MRHVVVPPASEAELLGRADALAGRTLAELAAMRRISVPRAQTRDKGWTGQLVESLLGATAQSRAEPDFPELGVELKTVPVTAEGRPLQSTYVCTAPLDGSAGRRWEDAWVRHKLARVLWIPIVGTRAVPLGDRIVGAPLMWSPSPEEEAVLRADWEELVGLIARGELAALDARKGEWLQVRPKGAGRDALVWALDEQADWVRDTPRGFYLRARFTAALFRRAFLTG